MLLMCLGIGHGVKVAAVLAGGGRFGKQNPLEETQAFRVWVA
jgi:hypothetical protein